MLLARAHSPLSQTSHSKSHNRLEEINSKGQTVVIALFLASNKNSPEGLLAHAPNKNYRCSTDTPSVSPPTPADDLRHEKYKEGRVRLPPPDQPAISLERACKALEQVDPRCIAAASAVRKSASQVAHGLHD
eukprot:g80290.t1